MDISSNRNFLKSFDWKLVIIYLLLIIIGIVNIYASIHTSESGSFLDASLRSTKQLIWAGISLGIGVLILFVIPANIWQNISLYTYIIVLLLLVAVIFFGVEVKGSRSWFNLKIFNFQPAEISKITTSLFLALLLSSDNFKLSKFKNFLIAAVAILIPMAIIICEKETGSALVYVGFIIVLYREGMSGWYVVALGMVILLFVLPLIQSAFISCIVLIGIIGLFCGLNSSKPKLWLPIGFVYLLIIFLIPSGVNLIHDNSIFSALKKINPVLWVIVPTILSLPYFAYRAYRNRSKFLIIAIVALIAGMAFIFSTDTFFHKVLQDHQRKRIEVLLGMKEDPNGVGYNVRQSMIAIGSGGFSGKGYLNGTQTTYGFVPEQSTDFIFCTIGEEWGFIGSSVVILLFLFLIVKIIIDAEKSREKFTRVYGYCVASCIFMHLFINIGMTIGIMPVIGIPLPLISYGGSSILSFTILIFIFIALDHQEKKYFI